MCFGFEQKEGTYKGKKFNAICHFFGYQARGSLPSKFDCDYAYVSGLQEHSVSFANDSKVIMKYFLFRFLGISAAIF